MGEVLHLQFSGATRSFMVTVDALTPLNPPEMVATHGPGGGPVAGRSLEVRFTFDDLDVADPALAQSLRVCLVKLEALTRSTIPAAATPQALEDKVAALARKEEAIAQDRLAATAEVVAKRAAVALLDVAIATKQAALAATEKPPE